MTSHGNDPLTLLMWFISFYTQATTSEETPPTKRAKLSKPLPSCGNGDVIARPAGDNDAKKLGKLSKFRISKPTRRTLKERGVKQLFPIQYLSFDSVYDGKDLIGQARELSGRSRRGCDVCRGGCDVCERV